MSILILYCNCNYLIWRVWKNHPSTVHHLLPRRTYISRHHRRLCSLGASSSPLCPLNDSRPRCCRRASTWLCRILSSSFPHHGSVLRTQLLHYLTLGLASEVRRMKLRKQVGDPVTPSPRDGAEKVEQEVCATLLLCRAVRFGVRWIPPPKTPSPLLGWRNHVRLPE